MVEWLYESVEGSLYVYSSRLCAIQKAGHSSRGNAPELATLLGILTQYSFNATIVSL